MNLTIANKIGSLQERLLGHFGSLTYQYAQLCVKAEAMSFLALEVGGYRIEDLADVCPHKIDDEGDDVTMDFYPKQTTFIPHILEGLMTIHPELTITLEKFDKSLGDDAKWALENQFVRVVMPEVDKDRRKLLLDGVEILYNKCCLNMDAEIAKCTAAVAPYVVDDPTTAKEVKEAIEDCKNRYCSMRENLTEAKKKEIEDAYNLYLQKSSNNDQTANNHPVDSQTTSAVTQTINAEEEEEFVMPAFNLAEAEPTEPADVAMDDDSMEIKVPEIEDIAGTVDSIPEPETPKISNEELFSHIFGKRQAFEGAGQSLVL